MGKAAQVEYLGWDQSQELIEELQVILIKMLLRATAVMEIRLEALECQNLVAHQHTEAISTEV